MSSSELPTGRNNPELAMLRERLAEAQFSTQDDGYPPHDEEAFQEGYPHKGPGGYGAPGEF